MPNITKIYLNLSKLCIVKPYSFFPDNVYKYFQFLGPTCHFRLSVIVAITWRHIIRARRSRKSRTCRWNFDAICCSSSGIATSSFGGHIAISGCRSMLKTLVDTFCELAVVENPRFCRRNCSDICYIVSEIYVLPVWMATLLFPVVR